MPLHSLLALLILLPSPLHTVLPALVTGAAPGGSSHPALSGGLEAPVGVKWVQLCSLYVVSLSHSVTLSGPKQVSIFKPLYCGEYEHGMDMCVYTNTHTHTHT